MRWTLIVAVGFVLAFRVAGAADAPGRQDTRTEAEWDRLSRSARSAAFSAASVEYWQRQGSLAQTEAWARKAIERMEWFTKESDAGLEDVTAKWFRGGKLILAFQRPMLGNMVAGDMDVLLANTRTEAAAIHMIETEVAEHMAHLSIKADSEKSISELRAEYLAGR